MNFDLSTLDRLVTEKKSSESKSTKFVPRAGVRAVSDQALQSPQIAAATPVAGSPDPSPAHLALALRSHVQALAGEELTAEKARTMSLRAVVAWGNIAAATPVAGSPDPSPAHLALALRSHVQALAGEELTAEKARTMSLRAVVAVGADGRIVIAEASLTVQAQERVENRRVVTDEHFRLNSYTYANRLHNERWGAEDTELFYKALSQFGTDFTLISHLFPGRQRPHLKNKFKRESKVNPRRVDAALKASASATATSYQPLSSPEQAALSPGEQHTSILEPVDPQKA
ncbi:Transcription factor TFIIIB component B'' [Auxenochlorella protothecoides]|uniref:Transcription factor TFIIIB component B n=1 Tax=Auxenochlorella protothecoides TaxID=3075 RepID=A0A087SPV8_AUXPR|nr:Transcription factor TFIIIB component B'' [Auxenochlorella protothecoides]KFM27762.1 Transcription factor TFIIIB component B'' [Auxenochlorella protothecoides]